MVHLSVCSCQSLMDVPVLRMRRCADLVGGGRGARQPPPPSISTSMSASRCSRPCRPAALAPMTRLPDDLRSAISSWSVLFCSSRVLIFSSAADMTCSTFLSNASAAKHSDRPTHHENSAS